MPLGRNTITIVTSPPPTGRTIALPGSPTTRQPVQYRIEERKRTVYVTSDIDPSEWHSQSLNALFTLTENAETGQDQSSPPVRRTQSLVEQTQVIVVEDNGQATVQSSPEFSSRTGPRSRRSAAKTQSSNSLRVYNSNNPFDTPNPSPIRPRILFYHKEDPHYGFTNFSAHPVMYKGKRYPTSEHLFQSFKFQEHRPNLAEHIRTCSERPSVAFSEARRFQPEVRRDWKQVNVQKMDETLWHKFTQHADLKAELLATGDAELVEDSDKDAFWGVGADGRGRNELGKALERLRTTFRGST